MFDKAKDKSLEYGKGTVERIIDPSVDVWWIPDIFENPLERYLGGGEDPKKEKEEKDKEEEGEKSLWEKGKDWISGFWGKEEEQTAKETYADAAGEKASLLHEIIEGVAMRYCPDTMKWWDMLRPVLNPILGEREELFSWENEFRWMTALGGEATPDWAQGLALEPLKKQIEKVAPEIAQAMEDDPEMPLEKLREMLQWYVVFKAATGKPYTAN
jgi:hypothetical protein